MNIIEAIKDDNLFRPFLGNDLGSWRAWFAALRVVYGLPVWDKASRAVVSAVYGPVARTVAT